MKDLRLFNKALLGKWLWWFLIKKGKLWREVVVLKYGTTNFGWFPSRSYGSLLLMGVVFGDAFLKVGRVSFLTFPLRWERGLLFPFGTISGMGKAF